MKVILRSLGTHNSGVLTSWANRERTISITMAVTAKVNGEEVFPEGSTLPYELEVEITSPRCELKL